MRVHSDGTFPECLIKDRRPNEPQIVFDYRQKIFIAKTKPYFSKIESTLQKIRRSSDWSIKYGEGSFDRIVDGEKMQDYAESKYPVFGSLTNWAFSLLLRNYLVDANALLLVSPLEIPTDGATYLKPVALIFNSENVIDYVDGDYAVMENKIGCTYGKNQEGKSFYVVTTERVTRYDQSDGRGNYTAVFDYVHGLGILPVFKLGGIVLDVYGHNTLYESRISGILPEFNEALREYSDLQAAVVLSMFPEKWIYTNKECTNCKGTGKVHDVIDGQPCSSICNTCNGEGYVAPGPYQAHLIKPPQENMGQSSQIPTPAMGYINGPVEIIKLQQESVGQHIYNGLAAINFEFLASSPLNQSGTAKEVDKDELNNTVHSVAEDIVRIIDNVYRIIAYYRYKNIYSLPEISEMLPAITVPEKYDILSTSYFVEQMKAAKDSKLNPAIINALETNYAAKTFNTDTSVAEHVGLILKLDPLAGIGEDDKMSRLSNNGITQLDYVVSSNINKFVDEATEEVRGFIDLDTTKQREIIYAKAQAQMDAEVTELMPTDTPPEDADNL